MDVTDPDRFDNDDLIEREAAMGRSNFMLQFMLRHQPQRCREIPSQMLRPYRYFSQPYNSTGGSGVVFRSK